MASSILLCAVCRRQARGFGWVDSGLPVASRLRDDSRRWFCSRRCQEIGAWRRPWEGAAMIDPTLVETTALAACLKPFGECIGETGFDKPLSAWSREEALRLIETVVTAFQEEMIRAAAGDSR